MLFIHENNLQNKIKHDYKGLGAAIQDFFDNIYVPVHKKLLAMHFSGDNAHSVQAAAEIFNDYYRALKRFTAEYPIISSQSKLESTFLEEMSVYLFRDLPELQRGELGVFNKQIFAGIEINHDGTVEVITKDVDFCIGKKVRLTIDQQKPVRLVLPVAAVEVKTYLDATMFGEIKSSSRAIKSASPQAKTYVLMGYRCLNDSHIIAARNDSSLNEMFALRENADAPIRADVLNAYYEEISKAVRSAFNSVPVNKVGKLLDR